MGFEVFTSYLKARSSCITAGLGALFPSILSHSQLGQVLLLTTFAKTLTTVYMRKLSTQHSLTIIFASISVIIIMIIGDR